MSFSHPETDERDAEKKRRQRQDAGRAMLGHLAALRIFETRWDRQDVERMSKLASLDEADLEKVQAIAWRNRRRLPREVAPKLPPHDPVVRAMEAVHG